MTIDTTRKELSGYTAVSPTTIHGWPAIFFSLPFMAAGIFIVLLSLNIIPCPDEKFHVSRNMVAGIGGMFFLAGFWVLIYGIKSQLQALETRRLIQQNPSHSWLADYRWDPRQISDHALGQVIQNFLSMIVFAGFIAFFHVIFFSVGKKDVWFVSIVLGIFDLVIVALFINCVYLFIRFKKYGTSVLIFNQFPFFLGDKLDVVLQTEHPVEGCQNLQVSLRFVEERYETRGTGKDRYSVVVLYQIYQDDLIIPEPRRYEANERSLRVPISLTLPKETEYATCLSQFPPRYWQLEIKAQTPGVDYGVRFLVPVYSTSSHREAEKKD